MALLFDGGGEGTATTTTTTSTTTPTVTPAPTQLNEPVTPPPVDASVVGVPTTFWGNATTDANKGMDITFTLLSDRSWISPSDSEQTILTKLSNILKEAGYQPFTNTFEGAFVSIANMIANSTYTSGVGDPYANPTTGNQGLTNWMSQNFTYEMAQQLGVDVTVLRSPTGNLSPDASGSYSSITHEFIPSNDPWARDRYGEKILDATGQPMLVPVEAYISLYTKMNGHAPTQEEIYNGTKDIIEKEGWYATGKTGGATSFNGTTSATTVFDPATGTYKTGTSSYTYNPQTGTLTNISGTGLTGTQYNDRVSVYSAMADRFNKYGLTGLADKIKQLAMDGASEATITLQLQETPEYQARFAANADRLKKGLTVLTPGEYVQLEDTYRQVLRAYGLTQFDNDAYVKQFISNDMSPTELSNRVVTAVQRVQNADPLISRTLKDYYGIGTNDLVAYVLDPNQQFQKIERQVAAAEIGSAARVQGLESGVMVAEQLASQGITQAQAQKGYATIADILPTAEKLTAIYGGSTGATYNQSTAEQEVFNSLASAQRARQKLTATEVATFSGSTGNAASALSTSTKGSI